MSLVVRGAGAAMRPGFPVPLSIRTCGFPAYGLPTVFWTWLRCLWVSDGAHELVQALVVEPGGGPAICLAGMQVAATLFDQQTLQPPRHVPVHLNELVRGVAGAEVIPPSPQEQVQAPDGLRQ